MGGLGGNGAALDQLGGEVVQRGARAGVRLDLLPLQFVHGPVVDHALPAPAVRALVGVSGGGRRAALTGRTVPDRGVPDTHGHAHAGRMGGFVRGGIIGWVVTRFRARDQVGQGHGHAGIQVDEQQLFLDPKGSHSSPLAQSGPRSMRSCPLSGGLWGH